MPVSDTVEVTSGGAGWSNFVILMLVLVIFPIITRLRHAAFESRRWFESDLGGDADSDDEEDE